MSDGQCGLEAVRARKFEEGVQLLDKALQSSNSPLWLLARSKALQMLKKYDLALEDAESAYHAAIERGSGAMRKLMIDAQYRRACNLFQLQRHADAACCAAWSMFLAEGRPAKEGDEVTQMVDENGNYTVTLEQVVAEKANIPGKQESQDGAPQSALAASTRSTADWNQAYVYRCQVVGAMKKLPADHPGRKVNVTKIPPKHAQRKASTASTNLEEKAPSTAEVSTSTPQVTPTEKPKQEKQALQQTGPVPVEKLKLRADFYQSAQNVTVLLFVKDVKKEGFNVRFFEDRIIFGPIPREAAPGLASTDDKSWSTILLPNPINTSESKYTVTPRKIELSLKKKAPVKWSTWGTETIGAAKDGSSAGPATAVAEGNPPAAEKAAETSEAKPAVAPTPAKGPAYPTSSKSGPKDWDKIGEKEPEHDSDINTFFKTLYKDATPDQQRAMMKSFIESNGTALSTDWNDVGARKVETIPPDGVEEKKW